MQPTTSEDGLSRDEQEQQLLHQEPPAASFCTKLGFIRWMIPTILISGFAMGLPLTETPNLMKETYGANDEFLISGILGAVQGFLAFFYGPVTGALSDRYGRKPVLIFCLFVFSLQYAAYVFSGNNFWGFGIGMATTGFTSGITSIVFAMAIDSVPLQHYPAIPSALSYMLGFYLLGATAGPIAGTAIGVPYVFWVGLVMCLLACLVARLTLPTEKVGTPQEATLLLGDQDQPAAAAESNQVSLGRQLCTDIKLSFTRPVTLLKRNKKLRIVALQVFLNQMAQQMLNGLLMLYLATAFPDFGASDQLVFALIWESSALFGLFFVVNQMKKYLGILNTLRAGLMINCVCMLGFGLANRKWQVYALGLPMGIVAIGVYPTAAALISGVCDQADLGAAQGIGGGGRMLAEGFSPFTFGILLQQFKGTSMPGAPFIIASFFVFVACALTTELRDLDPALTEGKWFPRKLKKKRLTAGSLQESTGGGGKERKGSDIDDDDTTSFKSAESLDREASEAFLHQQGASTSPEQKPTVLVACD